MVAVPRIPLRAQVPSLPKAELHKSLQPTDVGESNRVKSWPAAVVSLEFLR